MSKNLLIDIQEKPSPGKWFILSFQHVFAMFGSTVLVPFLTGLPVATALLCSGIGTLIYILCTKARCPIYIGSSFAFMPVICATLYGQASMPEGAVATTQRMGAVAAGLLVVGLIYIAFSIIIRLVGKAWIKRILPPIVVGPMIAVIGLSLASVACSNAGLVTTDGNANWQYMVVALCSLLATALVAVFAKGFFKIVPILSGIAVGFAVSVAIDLIFNAHTPDVQLILPGLAQVWEDITTLDIIRIPQIMLPFGENLPSSGPIIFYNLDFSAVVAFIPIAIVTIAEHIGDHTVLGKICGKDFIEDPGLDRTLLGDGLATAFAGLIGGPANTSYGENTGVVGMTRVGSVFVTGGAAVIAILLAFVKPIADLIHAIPTPVMGGICIILFGFIASNGLRTLVDAKVDFSETRNTIIAAVMLVLGLGGAAIQLNSITSLSGMALAAIAGVLLNLILPEKQKKNTAGRKRRGVQ